MRLGPLFRHGLSLGFSISLDSLQGYHYLLHACECSPGFSIPDPDLHGGKILIWLRTPRHQPLDMKCSGKEGSCSYLQQWGRQPSSFFFLFFFFRCPKINASIHKYFCSTTGEKERDGWLKPVYLAQKNNNFFFSGRSDFLKYFDLGLKPKNLSYLHSPNLSSLEWGVASVYWKERQFIKPQKSHCLNLPITHLCCHPQHNITPHHTPYVDLPGLSRSSAFSMFVRLLTLYRLGCVYVCFLSTS